MRTVRQQQALSSLKLALAFIRCIALPQRNVRAASFCP
jgi:hypothetical protein